MKSPCPSNEGFPSFLVAAGPAQIAAATNVTACRLQKLRIAVKMTNPATDSGPEPTIAVDVDGTLICGDMALMGSIEFVRRNPLNLFRLIGWAASGGRLNLKQQVAQRVALDPKRLIWRQDVIDFLRRQKRDGRRLVLATAAMPPHAAAVAEELGLFSEVLCSSEKVNLHSGRKADALDEKYGAGNWEYVGDSPHQDPPVFARARRSHMVRPNARMKESARQVGEVFGQPPGERNVRRALGLMQPADWLAKALLAFVIPAAVLAAHSQDFAAAAILAPMLQALLACCLAGSAADVAAAILSLAPGRRAGVDPDRIDAMLDMGIGRCLRIMAAFLAGFAVLASTLPAAAAVLLAWYAALALIRSIWLSDVAFLDAVAASLLHTLCLAAGFAAAGSGQFPALLAAAAALSLAGQAIGRIRGKTA